jgi:ABC-type hemin transport system ATPase subunit
MMMHDAVLAALFVDGVVVVAEGQTVSSGTRMIACRSSSGPIRRAGERVGAAPGMVPEAI